MCETFTYIYTFLITLQGQVTVPSVKSILPDLCPWSTQHWPPYVVITFHCNQLLLSQSLLLLVELGKGRDCHSSLKPGDHGVFAINTVRIKWEPIMSATIYRVPTIYKVLIRSLHKLFYTFINFWRRENVLMYACHG